MTINVIKNPVNNLLSYFNRENKVLFVNRNIKIINNIKLSENQIKKAKSSINYNYIKLKYLQGFIELMGRC